MLNAYKTYTPPLPYFLFTPPYFLFISQNKAE